MGSRIPVVVVSGLPGSGKTWLIERLLRDEPAGSAAVIARAQGSAPAGALFRLGGGLDAAPEGACPCCSLSGELSGALRDLFMAALQRRIPVPRHVLVETSGGGDPAAVLYSLHHDPFLRERYFYRGCVTAVAAQARLDGIGLRQAVLADALVLGPAPAGERERRRALRSGLEAINPLAPCFDTDRLPDLAHILARGDTLAAASLGAEAVGMAPGEMTSRGAMSTEMTLAGMAPTGMTPAAMASMEAASAGAPAGSAAGAGTLWSGARAGRLSVQRGAAVLRLAGRCELTRPQFLCAMDELQDACAAGILRIAAVLRLRGEAGAWELRGVHRQLYWQAAASDPSGAGSGEPAAAQGAVPVCPEDLSTLIAVLEAGAAGGFRRRAEALLTGLQAVEPAPRGAV